MDARPRFVARAVVVSRGSCSPPCSLGRCRELILLHGIPLHTMGMLSLLFLALGLALPGAPHLPCGVMFIFWKERGASQPSQCFLFLFSPIMPHFSLVSTHPKASGCLGPYLEVMEILGSCRGWRWGEAPPCISAGGLASKDRG